MSDRIPENAMSTIPKGRIREYTDFFVAAPGGFEAGEPVLRVREIPGNDGEYSLPRVMTVRHLVIEVADPENEATRDRISTAIAALMQRR